jgi:protein-S-isoprenylcysteine O-methyltransferase Ste14
MGIYRISRNPMYLGAVLAFAGFGLARHWTWLIVLTPVMAAAIQRLAIVREEAYLERRFGAAYLDYKSRVRRWI